MYFFLFLLSWNRDILFYDFIFIFIIRNNILTLTFIIILLPSLLLSSLLSLFLSFTEINYFLYFFSRNRMGRYIFDFLDYCQRTFNYLICLFSFFSFFLSFPFFLSFLSFLSFLHFLSFL